MASHRMKPLPQLPHERNWWGKISTNSDEPSFLPLDESCTTENAQLYRDSINDNVRSFFAANDPFTRRGRQQLKRTFLSSGPATARYAHLISAGKLNDTSGWRMGSLVSCYVVGVCLAVNTAFSIFATIVGPTSASEGIGTVYRGDCSKVKNLDQWLHLLINILGTAALSASNFNIQCLSSPTREEVDAAHIKGKWLDIGVPSIKNLRYIGWKRVTLWWCLAISTFPLHVLWNSVLFSTLQSNDYDVILVAYDFLDDSGPDCTSASMVLDPSNGYDTDVICDMFDAANANNLTKLKNKDYIKEYGVTKQSS